MLIISKDEEKIIFNKGDLVFLKFDDIEVAFTANGLYKILIQKDTSSLVASINNKSDDLTSSGK
jgi:hypothetical protein